VLLAEALAALMRSSSPEEHAVGTRLEELGIVPAASREDVGVQRQQAVTLFAVIPAWVILGGQASIVDIEEKWLKIWQ
jgi:hypothetical protein